MAIKIRLSRAGAKKSPYYHIVVADARAPRDGRFIEKIGTWNPMLPKDGERIHLKEDRIRYWLSNGALPTGRVSIFLSQAGIIKPTPRNNPNKGIPGKKAQARLDLLKSAQESVASLAEGATA